MRAVFLRDGGVACVARSLVDYRIHGGNTSRRFSLSYASRAALRASCGNLLKNEVAQVIELRKIARYRRGRSLSDADTEAMLRRATRLARSRAVLTFAIAKKPCRQWLLPALGTLRYRSLRPVGLRAAALALFPAAYRVLVEWRHRNDSAQRPDAEEY